MINFTCLTDEELLSRLQATAIPGTLTEDLARRLANALDRIEELEDDNASLVMEQ